MRAIRRGLLIHSCVYLQPKTNDIWNDNEYERVELKNVRIEPKIGQVITSTGEKVTYGSILFWDSTHSTHVYFEPNGKILFNGREMSIATVSEFYGRKGLHHIEVTLI